MESDFIQFYRNNKPNASGKHIADIMLFTFSELEEVHDYIQWIFPNIESSQYNADAPVFTEEDIQKFRTDESLQKTARELLGKMMRFYGFIIPRFEVGFTKIIRSSDFEERAALWVFAGNHNYLRITRIIKFLRLIAMNNEADAVFSAMVGVYADYPYLVGKKSLTFWLEAVNINLTSYTVKERTHAS